MAKIRILPDRVANQIAAGEVIERPAAVVKELVENALDAGATRIEVQFRDGGRTMIRVEDNGAGMSREDASLSLESHATSKIAEAGDLDRLGTFGFRGEALPSIASISRFVMRTREAAGDEGTEILVDGGKVLHVRDCGQPVGTSIEVTHLFHPVPARRKFLKTDQTEAAHIIQCVRLYALACPGTSFTLVEDGRVVFRSPECLTLLERVQEIFGRQIGEALVPIEASEPGMRLTGLVGKPGIGRTTRHEMVTFVNARPVDSRTLNYALIESYHDSLPKGRYPLAFVFFELSPAAVDVNVHPAKREVRFRSEPAVRSFVIRAVLARLRGVGEAENVNRETGDVTREAGDVTREAENGRRETGAVGISSIPEHRNDPSHVSRFTSHASRGPAAAWRLLGVAHGNFALFETAAGIVLLDRRAAHERIWYERLLAQFRAGTVPCQHLLLPLPVELDPVASAIVLDRMEFFRRHGFEIAEFGRHFFRIEALPGWLEPGDAEEFLRGVIGAIREGSLPEEKPELAREALAKLAAAKAIRLPGQPGAAEMEGVVQGLFATENPLTSPAGRPTFVELNHGELARRFGR